MLHRPLAAAAHQDKEEDEGVIRIWDLTTKKLRHVLTADTNGVFSLAFHPSGKTLAGGGADGTITFWDTRTGKQTEKLEGRTRDVAALAFSKDGTVLLSVGSDKQLLIWETGGN